MKPPGLASHGLQFRGRRLAVPVAVILVAQSPQAGQEPRHRLHPPLGRAERLELVAELREAGLADHQLSGKVHQLVELLDIDPQGLGRRSRTVGGKVSASCGCAVARGRAPPGWPPALWAPCRLGRAHRPSALPSPPGPAAGADGRCIPQSGFVRAAPESISTVNSSTPAIFRLSRTKSPGLFETRPKETIFQDVEFIELLRRRVEVAYLAQIGELVVDQLALEPRHRQLRLESRLGRSGMAIPAGAAAFTQRRRWAVISAAWRGGTSGTARLLLPGGNDRHRRGSLQRVPGTA